MAGYKFVECDWWRAAQRGRAAQIGLTSWMSVMWGLLGTAAMDELWREGEGCEGEKGGKM